MDGRNFSNVEVIAVIRAISQGPSDASAFSLRPVNRPRARP